MNEERKINLEADIPLELSGNRLDVALSRIFAEYSREKIKNWIKNGECLVDGKVCKTKEKVLGGEKVVISALEKNQITWLPEKINIDIEYIFEDEDIIVLNKPANLVVHPGAGNLKGTLANILLDREQNLIKVPRAGIVHRLDKDTTGLMVVAKNIRSHSNLVLQMQNRKIKRMYDAIVWGVSPAGSTIDVPIGRHPVNRKKMSVVTNGREAITHYRIVEKFRNNMHIKAILETGRTHQIRVHMAYKNYPLVGDFVYGRKRMLANVDSSLKKLLENFKRQALHSSFLGLMHPSNKKFMEWSIDLPLDMQNLILALRNDKESKF